MDRFRWKPGKYRNTNSELLAGNAKIKEIVCVFRAFLLQNAWNKHLLEVFYHYGAPSNAEELFGRNILCLFTDISSINNKLL